MVTRSVHLNRLAFESSGQRDTSPIIQPNNLPGGSKSFELVAKYFYRWMVNSSKCYSIIFSAHSLEKRVTTSEKEI